MGCKVTLEETLRVRAGSNAKLKLPIGYRGTYSMGARTGPSEPYQGGAKPKWNDPRFPHPKEWLLPPRESYPDQSDHEAQLRALKANEIGSRPILGARI